MDKQPKRKFLLTLLFIAMLTFSTYAYMTPSVGAAESTIQQKGATILSNVIGLDTSKYSIDAKTYQPTTSDSYRGIIPQVNVAYDLVSESNKQTVLCTFANGNLQMIQVLENEGTPSMTKTAAANTVTKAQDFLSNYQAYTGNRLFGELRATLDNLVPNKNVNKTQGNTVIQATFDSGYSSFKWYYTSNGVDAEYSKFIALVFKEDFLSGFVDNWQFYNMGSEKVNLSEKDAMAIALEAAKAHSWSLKLETDALDTKNFNESNVRWTSLIFDSSLGANKTHDEEDPLALYPVWRVGIALNKWYGYMYGIQVDIWADTGEVRHVQEAWSTMPPPENTPTANVTAIQESYSGLPNKSNLDSSDQVSLSTAEPDIAMITLLPFALASGGILSIFAVKRKLVLTHLKAHNLKRGRFLVCILLLTVLIVIPVEAVSAASKTAVIWGSESTGAGAYPTSWRKSQPEIDQQRATSITLRTYFQEGGFTAYNHQGIRSPGSSKAQIISDISTYTDGSSRAVFVDFDHGVGNPIGGEFHLMFEDNIGTYYDGGWHPEAGVYDKDIFPWTWYGKTFLAFINTCLSANLTYQGYGQQGATGLPYAFSHGRMVVDREQGATAFHLTYGRSLGATQSTSGTTMDTIEWTVCLRIRQPLTQEHKYQYLPSQKALHRLHLHHTSTTLKPIRIFQRDKLSLSSFFFFLLDQRIVHEVLTSKRIIGSFGNKKSALTEICILINAVPSGIKNIFFIHSTYPSKHDTCLKKEGKFCVG
jgi:hypothetical protein